MKNLLDKLKNLDIHVFLNEGKLKIKTKHKRIPPDILVELKENKAALIEYLKLNEEHRNSEINNSEIIDCLFIGHNEIDIDKHVSMCENFGKNSSTYRDLELSFINYKQQPFSFPDIYNYFLDKNSIDKRKISISETFSLAIAVLGTSLEKNGLSFDFVNEFKLGQDDLVDKLTNKKFRTISIITTLYVDITPIIEIIEFIRKFDSEVKIVIGGPYVTTCVRSMKAEEIEATFNYIGADYFINSSQGESTLIKLLNALKFNRPLNAVPNLFYWEGSEFVRTEKEVESNTLAENPVNWKLFTKETVGDFINVRTVISCPYACAFCSYPEHAGEYQTNEVELVKGEFDLIREYLNIKNIYVIDDTFNVPKDRFKQIMRMMIKEDYGFKWHSYYRCQFADEESVSLMKEAGCEGVHLGIESASDVILKNMKKGARVKNYYNGVEMLNKYDITSFGSFIIGFPGETKETAMESFDFIQNSGLDFYRTQIWFYEHITPIWREKEKYDLTGQGFKWEHKTMNHEQASDLNEYIFANVTNCVWVPQYNFSFDGIWHLIHRGYSLDEVKQILDIFKSGIDLKRNKMTDSNSMGNLMNSFENLILQNSNALI